MFNAKENTSKAKQKDEMIGKQKTMDFPLACVGPKMCAMQIRNHVKMMLED